MDGYKLTPMDEFIREHDPTEHVCFTVDGKCSRCGGCCSNTVPVIPEEIERLKQYVEKNGIKSMSMVDHPNFEWPSGPVSDMTCPFKDPVTKDCTIYRHRPKVCKLYICNMTQEEWDKTLRSYPYYYANKIVINWRNTIFNESSIKTKPEEE